MKKTREVTTRLFVILLPLLALCATMYAQTGLGTIAGIVTDPSGAVVVGATVTATDVATGVKTSRPTNSTGFYEILDLLVGPYTVEAVAPGFKTFKREGITLNVGDRLTINLSLTLGQNTEVVSVTAEAPLLRTQDAETGEVVDNNFIMNLPQLQRDPLQMLTISGNVQGNGARANGGAGAACTAGACENDTRINGGRTSGIDYLVDGISQTSGMAHTATSVTPGMEDVSEFKVVTNGMSAEYGRASGGLVELVTKSGSNELHGQLFEYFQNNVLNAGSWYNNSFGISSSVYRNNDFGFALGGPVFIPKLYHGKNKTFFFANYEGVRYSTGGGAAPNDAATAAMRTGDFSGAAYDGILPVLYDQNAPDSTLATVSTVTAGGINGISYQGCASPPCIIRTVLLGDGLHIPASRMSGQSVNDPTGFALGLQALDPLPNTPGDQFSADETAYIGTSVTTSTTNTFSARIDENITDNQRIFGRFTHQGSTYESSPTYGALSTSSLGLTPGAWQQQLDYDWTINPTTIFSARLGGTFTPGTSGTGYTNPSLINALPWNPATPGNPSAQAIMGSGDLPLMDPYTGPVGINLSSPGTFALSNYTNYEGTASLTKILAHQTLKFGFETRRYYDNFITAGASNGWQGGGWWRFNQDPTSYAVGDFASTNANEQYANGYAAVLLGVLDYDPTFGGTARGTNFNYYAGYVQDDVRVTSKLTLNLGVRWDMESPLTERYNNFLLWDPTANVSSIGVGLAPGFNWNNLVASAGLNPANVVEPAWASAGAIPNGMVVTPDSAQHPSRNITNWHPYQFAPRLGFAYQLTPKTVIRGSFAQMYITTMANPQTNSTDQDVSTGAYANGGWHTWDITGIPYAHMINSFADPYHIGVNSTPVGVATPPVVASALIAPANATMIDEGGGSAINQTLHMPYEITQSFGIQRELPHGFLVEATYSGNEGRNLVGPSYPSLFPKSLFVPQNAATYSTYVQNPFVGTGLSSVPMTRMEEEDPEYAIFDVLESNVGRSNYNSVNFRAERRLWHGMTFLFNYTFAKMLDDVGGAEIVANNPFQTGTGGKTQQSVDPTINAMYGYSPLDEKSRISTTYSIELPFGRGHQYLGSPKGAAQLIADGVIGGWQLAGTGIYRSGRPVIFGNTNNEIDNSVGILTVYGTVLSNNLTNPGYVQTGYGLNTPLPANAGRFNTSQFLQGESFVYGNMAPVYGNIRQPGNGQIDLSLMKKFPLSAEANKRYLQLRLEASNALNIRGLANYDTTLGHPTFGYVSEVNGTIAGDVERHAQISARIVF